ncbi:gallinacin-14-like [Sphaerodactylus townsendi]|uniref:gallinacin-14-like n=1 Tax=Sphaerodactylus townsendi TaxID=933632 RepID=UPI002026D876|nr:gallinacin-14-like [Sphaerodactylus townsendi]
MKIFCLLFALMLLPCPAISANIRGDTVACKRDFNFCATLICPFFYKASGTCYNQKQKCCKPWI